MRWFKKPIPRDGENRIRRRFLWLPLTIDQETRWLERAAWLEVAMHSCMGWGWKPYQFINEGESDE